MCRGKQKIDCHSPVSMEQNREFFFFIVFILRGGEWDFRTAKRSEWCQCCLRCSQPSIRHLYFAKRMSNISLKLIRVRVSSSEIEPSQCSWLTDAAYALFYFIWCVCVYACRILLSHCVINTQKWMGARADVTCLMDGIRRWLNHFLTCKRFESICLCK